MIRFGVTLPQIKRSWQETRAAALELEALGFHSLWLNDHLYGIPMPTIPILEAWTTLSAVGAVTTRAELGLLVSPPGFRNPALHAKMAATLDHVTDGRVIMGLGAGWFAQEFTGYGFDFPSTRDRLQQLREAIVIMKKMWTEEAPSFAGEHFRIDSVICAPKPARRPPILVGGGGEKVLLRLVAQYADACNFTDSFDPAFYRHKLDVLRKHCEELGRDYDAIEKTASFTVGPDDDVDLAALAAAGIETFIVYLDPPTDLERLERFAGAALSKM